MRKISLIPYKIADGATIEVEGKDGVKTLVKHPDIMYNMKQATVNMLFNPSNKLAVRDLIEHDRIARMVEAAGDDILLEETEYAQIKDAVQTFTGWFRNDLEFVHRVMDAEKITVKEA